MPNANPWHAKTFVNLLRHKGGDNISQQDEIMEIHRQVLKMIEILGQMSAILETIETQSKEQYDADLQASAKEIGR
ncbi:uncharacterized protein BDCG_16837 [Blastomyces dermatitidis ER-3]|uniref:Uncharacterized protein n=1 Tax=Ajellomyces dermatitidis (strain ER-3 / ATCC MYA-2586) TaxID=559297 RepID=A0ABX2VV17_AJEDR|nr:uncharacterized protein BDCG_16837 [Blastomyces dermatitidis ER-3]OAT01004.1 hypothetical protein BDCG_16837 [Blastomyces dermatitidis ER-3]